MRIIKDILEIEKLKLNNTVVALGKFDGMHKGHYSIMEKLQKEKTNGFTSLVFTFSENPIYKGKKIFTNEEKFLVYEKLGIDIIIVYPIESGILTMSPKDFIEKILVERLGVKRIICGENFRFGKNRVGDSNLLKAFENKYNYTTEVLPLISYKGQLISSTTIRKNIQKGYLKAAKEMLGHGYFIVGKVVHGNEIGRTLDTPTANIIPSDDKLLPPNGVYISVCNIDGITYRGVTNIGYKPTVQQNEPVLGVETYFQDFSGNLYDKVLEIELISFIRGEEKFRGLDQLKEQLSRDKMVCKNEKLDI